jgi:hypothetical protein
VLDAGDFISWPPMNISGFGSGLAGSAKQIVGSWRADSVKPTP